MSGVVRQILVDDTRSFLRDLAFLNRLNVGGPTSELPTTAFENADSKWLQKARLQQVSTSRRQPSFRCSYPAPVVSGRRSSPTHADTAVRRLFPAPYL
jgi:hypothetical protein